MNLIHNPSMGALILRIALAAVLLSHSVYLKMMVFTLPGTAEFFVSLGLPGWLAYAVFFTEAIGGVAILLGIFTRQFAIALIPILLGATWAHLGNGWLFTNANGGWEYPLFLAFMSTALMLIGSGEYAIKPDHESTDARALNGMPSQGSLARS